MLPKPGRKMDEQYENPNKELENIRKKNPQKQSGLKNIITEMKNIVKGINNRLEHTEEQIRDLEDKIMEIKQ